MKIGMYTEDEIFKEIANGFLGRSMYDAIFDKIHALITQNEQLQSQLEQKEDNWNKLKEWLEEVINYEEYDKVERDTFKKVLEKLQEIEGGMNE